MGLRAVGSDPDGDSLRYTWSSSAGRIVGSGAQVSLDTSGVTPPTNAIATVRVSDGHGGSADASCPVRIPAPERAPETLSCESAGFPLNLARLNNVDKACLDDMALRLRQDPRGRVIVVGHADTAERRPAVVARLRAEAAKTYLVAERGVEEGRISVQGAEPTRSPASGDSGTRGHSPSRRGELDLVVFDVTSTGDRRRGEGVGSAALRFTRRFLVGLGLGVVSFAN